MNEHENIMTFEDTALILSVHKYLSTSISTSTFTYVKYSISILIQTFKHQGAYTRTVADMCEYKYKYADTC